MSDDRLTRLEVRFDELARRVDALEDLPRDIREIHASVEEMRGRLTIIMWLLTVIAGGIIVAGFELFRR